MVETRQVLSSWCVCMISRFRAVNINCYRSSVYYWNTLLLYIFVQLYKCWSKCAGTGSPPEVFHGCFVNHLALGGLPSSTFDTESAACDCTLAYFPKPINALSYWSKKMQSPRGISVILDARWRLLCRHRTQIWPKPPGVISLSHVPWTKQWLPTC